MIYLAVNKYVIVEKGAGMTRPDREYSVKSDVTVLTEISDYKPLTLYFILLKLRCQNLKKVPIFG